MGFDENKTFAELAIEGIGIDTSSKKTETEPIAEYLLKQFDTRLLAADPSSQ